MDKRKRKLKARAISKAKSPAPMNRAPSGILLAPNKLLRTRAVECTSYKEGKEVADKLFKHLHLAIGSGGVGLAANQIGILKRVIVVKTNIAREWLINPVIISSSIETEVAREGCLSYPGIFKDIERYCWVEVSHMTPNGVHQAVIYRGYTSRVVQHEIDHLNGICKVGMK